MFCQNCGSKLEDGAKFCTNCGKKVEIAFPLNVKPDVAAVSESVINTEAAEAVTEISEKAEEAEKAAFEAAESIPDADEIKETVTEKVDVIEEEFVSAVEKAEETASDTVEEIVETSEEKAEEAKTEGAEKADTVSDMAGVGVAAAAGIPSGNAGQNAEAPAARPEYAQPQQQYQPEQPQYAQPQQPGYGQQYAQPQYGQQYGQYAPNGGQQYGRPEQPQYAQPGQPQYGQQYGQYAPNGGQQYAQPQQPGYGQQYAQPQYGQQYGQYAPNGGQQYGGQQYGRPGQPGYGQQYAQPQQPGYGQQYAQPQYGQQYGQPRQNQPQYTGPKKGMVWHYIFTFGILIIAIALLALYAIKSPFGTATAEYAFIESGEDIDICFELTDYTIDILYDYNDTFSVVDILARAVFALTAIWSLVNIILLASKKKSAPGSVLGATITFIIASIGYFIYIVVDFADFEKVLDSYTFLQFPIFAVAAIIFLICNCIYYSKRKNQLR